MATMTMSGKRDWARIIMGLSVAVLVSLIVWLLWPVQITLEGNGIIQPVFEHLVRVIPPESGVVCKVTSARLNEVRKGEVLLEYIPVNKASFLAYSTMASPGGISQPEALPEWYTELEQRRKVRIDAANRWQGLMFKQHPRPWERELASRFVRLAVNEGDLERIIAQQRENVRLGREAANRIYVFDDSLGRSVAAERGIPLASPADGILYSFWVQPAMQITGALPSNLPAVPSGSAPMRAIGSGTAGTPVAEILPPAAPREVLGLVPAGPHLAEFISEWQAVLAGTGTDAVEVANIEFGSVPISPADAKFLVPGLAGAQESVFVRLRLKEGNLPLLNRTVGVRLVSARYPRVWFWLKGIGY
jgi:hypothetical protein